jgi:hypothetical protein
MGWVRPPQDQEEFLEHGRFRENKPSLVRGGSRWYLILSVLIYAASFLMPAVRLDTGGSIPGWMCALVTLSLTGLARGGSNDSFLLVLVAFINPLLLIYLALLPFAGMGVPRFALASAIAALIPVSAVYLAIVKMGIDVGYFFWIVGLGLIAGSEIFRGIRHMA